MNITVDSWRWAQVKINNNDSNNKAPMGMCMLSNRPHNHRTALPYHRPHNIRTISGNRCLALYNQTPHDAGVRANIDGRYFGTGLLGQGANFCTTHMTCWGVLTGILGLEGVYDTANKRHPTHP